MAFGGNQLNNEQGFAPMSGFQGGGSDPYGRATQGAAFQYNTETANRRQQAQLFGLGQQGENYRAGLAAQAQMYPATLQQSRFNTLYPTLLSQLGGGNPERVGGSQVGTAPQISAAPVWNNQQIQAQVNNQQGRNDVQTASAKRQIAGKLGGQGYGANSPLQQALGSMQDMQNLTANQDAATNIRWGAAQGNAQQLLAGQQAQEQQFAQRQQEDIERRKNASQYVSSIFAALSGMV